MSQDPSFTSASDARQPRTIDEYPLKSVLCALISSMLLFRAAAAMHLDIAVPVIALNFIGVVIWAQFYSR